MIKLTMNSTGSYEYRIIGLLKDTLSASQVKTSNDSMKVHFVKPAHDFSNSKLL